MSQLLFDLTRFPHFSSLLLTLTAIAGIGGYILGSTLQTRYMRQELTANRALMILGGYLTLTASISTVCRIAQLF